MTAAPSDPAAKLLRCLPLLGLRVALCKHEADNWLTTPHRDRRGTNRWNDTYTYDMGRTNTTVIDAVPRDFLYDATHWLMP